MGQEPGALFSFQCDGRQIDVNGYIILLTDFWYPQQPDHPTRASHEKSFTIQAHSIFNHFPVITIWPDDSDCDVYPNRMCRYRGVHVFADCYGTLLVPGASQVAEKLIVTWFQRDHRVLPDPAIVPLLERLPWRQLAVEIDDD